MITPKAIANAYDKIIEEIDRLDKKYTKHLFNLKLPYLDEFFFLFAYVYNPGPIVLNLAIILILQPFDIFVKMVITVLTGLSMTLMLKHVLARQRPACLGNRKYNFRKSEQNCSMPSGDSFQAGLWAASFSLYFGTDVLYTFVPLVMLARCYYQCHFISDTIVGASLGVAWAKMIYSSFNGKSFKSIYDIVDYGLYDVSGNIKELIDSFICLVIEYSKKMMGLVGL